MPSDTIDRAIKRASGQGDARDQFLEITYEGYGPGGTAIFMEVLTDNRNRTLAEVRSTLTKAGANLANSGAVAWQFEQQGVVVAEVSEEADPDDLALVAIDAGADDFDTYDHTLHAYSAPQSLEEIRNSLAEMGASISSSEVSMVPTNIVPLNEGDAMKALRLLDQLEELDDVQKVYSNADFPDEALERYRDES